MTFSRQLGRCCGALLAVLAIGVYPMLVEASLAVVRVAMMGGLSVFAGQSVRRARCDQALGSRYVVAHSRPFVVAMSASFPAASASIHHEGANSLRPIQPPAASAATMRAPCH